MTLPLNRILYSYTQANAEKTFIFICGIHGNEPAGIYGIQRVVDYIKEKDIELNCNFYAVIGNINAYKKKVRFETKDLNRLWTKEHIRNVQKKTVLENSEEHEQIELFNCLKTILNTHEGTFVFTDIHTTSSKTLPFITISDSLNNRKVAAQFSIPIVLGIEEYLDGPLLTYINEFGYTALGFEAGQHLDSASIDNSEAFVWLLLSKMDCVDKKTFPFGQFKKTLEPSKTLNSFYEINFRYGLEHSHTFKMLDNFDNFEPIKKGQLLAKDNDKMLHAVSSGKLFLPLYQNQGTDGFFIITKISSFWLVLSRVFRLIKLHNILSILPGVKQDSNNKYMLIVNPKTAKFLATEVFHLFGYRKKIKDENLFYFIRRDREIMPLK